MSVHTLAASSDAWQSRISVTTGEPAVPVFNRKLRGDIPFWVPRRYVSVVAQVMSGRRFTMRELATLTRYSLKGVQQALWSLHEMAILSLTTVRGCRGYSVARFNNDCVAGNVSTNVTVQGTNVETPSLEVRTLVETFTLAMGRARP